MTRLMMVLKSQEFKLIVADGVDETLRQESAANVSLYMDAEDNYDEGVCS